MQKLSVALLLALVVQSIAGAAEPPNPGLAQAMGPGGGGGFGQLRTLLSQLYVKYDSGKVPIPEAFSVAAGFRIEQDGSLSAVRLTKSSGSSEIDRDALAVLHALGESK